MFVTFITKDKQAVLQEIKRLCLTENCITFSGTENSIYFESSEKAQSAFNSICRAVEQGKPLYKITQEVAL